MAMHQESSRHLPCTKLPRLSRRRFIALGAGAAASALIGLRPRPAQAVLRLDVTQGNVQPLPIALPDFVGVGLPDPGAARGVTQIIAANLQRSGLFAPIDPTAYIERISSIDDQPRLPDCRQINCQALDTRRPARLQRRTLGADWNLWADIAGQPL